MKKEIRELIGQRIKSARENARLTQEELSELLECTPQYISLMENGRYCISIDMLRTFCTALNVSSDSILFSGHGSRSLEVISSKCENLTDEQFRLLLEIIERYIEAVGQREN